MHCLAIQHVKFEDLGCFESVLKEEEFTVEYVQSGVDDISERRWLEVDLAVVLGGPIGVNDIDLYPHIGREIELIRRRMQVGKPLLGICLGAQMIAAAMGARVYPGKAKEIGWGTIDMTAAGSTSSLSALASAPVLHWHGDTFDLPEGATLLASTDITPHQAFSVGAHTLALQFHPEAEGTRIEEWLIGHTCELLQNKIDPRSIREETKLVAQQAYVTGQQAFRAWLKEAGIIA